MATTLAPVETGHEDMVHDAQLDYYGKRLATASSDRSVRVFDISGDQRTLTATIKGHEAPVWGVAWAPPMFGSVLASCSYDKKVIIWREDTTGEWTKLFEHTAHSASVNAIAFAPQEFGLLLACASSDGSISILSKVENQTWNCEKIEHAHELGVNSLAWAPAVAEGSLTADSPTPLIKRLVSGGCDNRVRIYRHSETAGWSQETMFDHHVDWVRGVAWAANVGLPSATIASCSQDGDVVVWARSDMTSSWEKKVLFSSQQGDAATPWSVSFSLSGNILAVACGDGRVLLWKEDLDGVWRQVSSLSEAGVDA
eukprot:c21901_g1_i1.p1 GENE.c21901_g1_i1~~c21901_g1_i1.p1  ORF type:complete len:312 (-),score=48.08 c21901_g1_i1:21-956(-)